MNKTTLKFLLLPTSVLMAMTTGCGLGSVSSIANTPVATPAAKAPSGVVMGGQQPVAGVTLQLYTVGTTAYGSAGVPLGASFTTTAFGNFTFPAYTCPSAGALTFLTGTGGQPIAAVPASGSTPGTPAVTNNNLAMIVGLGACSSVGSSFVDLNEVTTVATVWSLSPFMTGITNIGAPASNALGIQNAFAAINKVVNTVNGQVSGPALPSNATLPVAEINTLADVLEQCVNSGGGSASDTSTGCGKLFSYTTVGSNPAPTDTVTAAMNIAQHPAQNVAQLNVLRSAQPVFQPAINVNSAPSDWTIAISYTGGGLNTPQGVATDQQGNVWVANSGNSSVSAFSSVGTALSPAAGFTAGAISVPYALAIDQSGNVWVANSGGAGSVTKLSASGTTGTNYAGNGLNVPKSIAIDGTGNVFLANSGANSFSGFTSGGAPLSGSPFTGGGLNAPVAIAISTK